MVQKQLGGSCFVADFAYGRDLWVTESTGNQKVGNTPLTTAIGPLLSGDLAIGLSCSSQELNETKRNFEKVYAEHCHDLKDFVICSAGLERPLSAPGRHQQVVLFALFGYLAPPSTADSSSAPPPGRRTEKVQSVGVRLWTSFDVTSMYECTSVGAASVSTTVDEWAVL